MTFYPETMQWNGGNPKFSDKYPFRICFSSIERHFPAHRHDCLELSLIEEGEGYQIINDRKYIMRPGTFTFLLPYQVHEIHTTSEQPLRLFNYMFGLDFLFLSSTMDTGLADLLLVDKELTPSIQLDDAEYHAIQQTMTEMTMEFGKDHLWRNHLLYCKLSEVIIRFDRIRRADLGQGDISSPAKNMKSMWSVIRYVYHHYCEELTLSDVAHTFGMSAPHLSEAFKKHIGRNFLSFLHELRIRHASALLTSTDMSVLDVALEVGFNSPQVFTRIFRKIEGVTPSDYREGLLL